MRRRYKSGLPPGSVFASLVAVLLIAVAVFAPAAWAFPGATPSRADFNMMTGTGPVQYVAVIVQKADTSSEAEDLVESLGGTITERFSFINAFAAQIPVDGLGELAECSGIRAVTRDAGMSQSAGEVTFTTWATELGASMPTTFDSADQAVDSGLGPNETFASSAYGTASFAGLASEVTPGNRIKKVELAVHAYIPAKLAAGQDPTISVSVDGVVLKTFSLNHKAFENSVGIARASTVYLDVTSARVWSWADFDKALEVRIDQTKFSKPIPVYYDAVGLRVTSELGADPSANSGVPSESTVGPLDGTKQENKYNAAINATKVWNGQGYLQGNKVGIAIVDSGVVKTKDLKGRNRRNVNFNPGYHNGTDLYGHGTFVAGIIAGSGAASGGKYMGVAPKADYINLRVSDDQGACSESDVISALQWIYENSDKYNIRVVNLSLNSDTPVPYEESPLDAACEVLWFNGIVVVCSAGNNGDSNLYPPANDPFVITVGATDDKGTATLSDDAIASFSAYGTSGGVAKPELVAPGTNIVGLLPDNGKLKIGVDHPSNRLDKTYFKMSGTSMSAPMVTGAVALLLQDEPNLTPDQVKYRLMATANKAWDGYASEKAGSGYLDVLAAVNGTTTASANTGLAASPMLWTGDAPVVWDSVMWRSVMWRSVSWDSVMWRSVMWRSVMWRSDYWE